MAAVVKNCGFCWAWSLSTIFPFLRPLFCTVCKFMCTQWRPSVYSLYVPTVASRIQSSFGHSLHISLTGIEMTDSLPQTFSAHKYVLIGSTDCTALVQCHSSMWSGPTSLTQFRLRLCFETQQWNDKSRPSQVLRPRWPAPSKYPCPPVAGLQNWATSPDGFV